MPTLGLIQRQIPNGCPLCKKTIAKGSRVYVDVTKSTGKHVVHEVCYDGLVASRGGIKSTLGRALNKPTLSSEPLDPPF